MIRKLSRNWLGMILALLVLLVQAEESFGGHVCPILDLPGLPHHGPRPSGAEGAGHLHPGHHAHRVGGSSEEADHCGNSETSAHSCHGADAAESAEFEHCPCIGSCQPTPGVAIASDPLETPESPPLEHSGSVAPSLRTLGARRPPYFLPYSLAPPHQLA